MKFTKMQGIGNDYVYVDCFKETVARPAETARFVSDRHFGIGSDGLILICPSDVADCRMDMYNADGSGSAMCGNGIRCVGKYVYDHGIVDRTNISVETPSGVKYLELHLKDGKVDNVTVDMGQPECTSEVAEKILVGKKTWSFTGISMGNPHAVVFLDQIEDLNLEELGPGFERHPRFPERTNTEFVKVENREHLRMRVWERGSGETFACGTGACAVAVASALIGYADRDVKVSLLGGNLTIRWDERDNHVYMTGPAAQVFHGEIDLPVD